MISGRGQGWGQGQTQGQFQDQFRGQGQFRGQTQDQIQGLDRDRGSLQNGSGRGKPVVALFSILAVWIALRVVFWQSPLALPAETNVPLPTAIGSTLSAPVASSPPQQGSASQTEQTFKADSAAKPDSAMPRLFSPVDPHWVPAPLESGIERPLPETPLLRDLSQPRDGAPAEASGNREIAAAETTSARRVVGHSLLLAVGLSQIDVPPLLAAYIQGGGPIASDRFASRQDGGANASASAGSAPLMDTARPFPASTLAEHVPQEPASRRWSADGWALWRDDAGSSQINPSTRPSYGRSQIGAVMRYSLAPQSGQRPRAYIRGSAALDGPREKDMAAGLSARLLPDLPVRLAAEARLSDRAEQTQLRVAAYGVSEFPPVDLPGGLTAEAYVQAGYVSGDFATGFVDGQARITGKIVATDDFTLSAGTGVWGGAQKGAKRLDIGPSASVTFAIGEESYGRVSADYRFRVAGDAAPASGPALTLSAGF